MNWWQTVDNNWKTLYDLIAVYHPAAITWKKVNKRPYLRITAENAEKACEGIRTEINKEYKDIDVMLLAKEAKENRNTEQLRSIFSETWFGMPESSNIRSVPGFWTLCDLLESDDELED